jgi:hypothetical protein
MKEISRKKFLRICGSIVAGGTVAGVSGVMVNRRFTHTGANLSGNARLREENAFISPYKLVSSFDSSGDVQAFAQFGDRVYVATPEFVSIYDSHGKLQHQFSVGDETVRDMAVDGDEIYLLYPAGIEVRTHQGEMMRKWEACSELSSYCSFALAQGFVFVTDMNNKNICKYTKEGNFVKFIGSPNGFIIPSLTFGIECIGDVLYCSNSGRHQVERYTLDGSYIGSFGKPGGAPGLFTGCCNPVHLSHTAHGDIITSEKGTPRISCYGSDGKFQSILLDNKSLGGGNTAYDIKVWEDKLYVAGKNKVSVFRYDERLASAGACSDCGVNCPLRTGII